MVENRKKFRVSVQAALIFEASLIAVSVAIGYIIYPLWEEIWLAPAMLIIYLLMCTAPMAYLKGFDFSLHDLEEGFPWIHYHFVSIFIASALAPFFNSGLYSMIGELKLG